MALGLLVRDGERFRNAPDVARFLVEGEPAYAGSWMLFSKPDWTFATSVPGLHGPSTGRFSTPGRGDRDIAQCLLVDDAVRG
jgi:hypothetical protein